VGDGINDSAALAHASVSISFAGATDMARETADIVLMDDDLSSLLLAVLVARHAMRVVRQNAAIVVTPNVSGMVWAALIGLNPVAAVLINNGSAIVAEMNGFRPLMGPPGWKELHEQRLALAGASAKTLPLAPLPATIDGSVATAGDAAPGEHQAAVGDANGHNGVNGTNRVNGNGANGNGHAVNMHADATDSHANGHNGANGNGANGNGHAVHAHAEAPGSHANGHNGVNGNGANSNGINLHADEPGSHANGHYGLNGNGANGAAYELSQPAASDASLANKRTRRTKKASAVVQG
jgi:Cu2+-exporting ATPase